MLETSPPEQVNEHSAPKSDKTTTLSLFHVALLPTSVREFIAARSFQSFRPVLPGVTGIRSKIGVHG